MEEAEFEKLEQIVQYINEEHMIGNQEFLLFRDAQHFIDAVRQNKISEIPWTEQMEIDYQKEKLEEEWKDN